MIVAALVFGACQFVVFLCFAVVARIWYDREKARVARELARILREWVTPPDDKTPSQLAVLIDQSALVFAARLVQQIKAMLAGTESGLSKAETTQLALEIGEGGNPWLGILSGILPKRLRNQLLRNPQMVGALSKLTAGSNHGSGASTGSVADRLKNQQG